jgi:hypothetical protein
MNEIRLIALVSFVAIFTTACGGGDGGGSGSGSDNDDPSTEVILSPTMAKEILFTEIMANPDSRLDAIGEWFEIQNPGPDKLSLQNCVFMDKINAFFINFDLEIEPGEYLTLAISPNPGFTPDISYAGTGLTLNNAPDTLTMTCNGIVIDRRQYTMPSSGRSSGLSNDSSGIWCDDRVNPYASGDTGTPGLANIDC